MLHLRVLNAKHVKLIKKFLKDQYGFEQELAYAFFLHEKDQKIYLISKAIGEIPYEKIRINSLGLYFGQYSTDHSEIRLSVEGSQIIGPYAKKNRLQLDDETFNEWLAGKDILTNVKDQQGYLLISNNKGDFLGTGREKNGKILNFVPKSRYVKLHSTTLE